MLYVVYINTKVTNMLRSMASFSKSSTPSNFLKEWMESIRIRETWRQKNTLNLIPSENIAFPEVYEAVGSDLCNKYSEGYSGSRYYAGNEIIDEVENKAIDLAKKVFHVPFVNVQPYSGSIANREVYETVMEKDDTFMGMDLSDGGHLTHGFKTNKWWKWVPYHVNPNTGMLDMEAIRSSALKVKPKLIWCGATAYSRMIPFKEFGEIADECGAYLAADISHISGLVAGGVHRSPHKYAHIITTTTHKLLRGPRAAMIMVTDKGLEKDPNLGKKINSAVFPGMQGGPHNEKIFGMAVMLHLVSEPSFQNYARQVVKNTICLANRIQDSSIKQSAVTPTIKIVSGGTDNHLMVLDLTEFGKGRGVFAQLALESIGVICNKNTVPADPSSPFYPSGIRIGMPTLTSRGAVEEDMKELALVLVNVIHKTMYIINTDNYLKDFPEGTREDRAFALKRFKELLRFSDNENFLRGEMDHVVSIIKRLDLN